MSLAIEREGLKRMPPNLCLIQLSSLAQVTAHNAI